MIWRRERGRIGRDSGGKERDERWGGVVVKAYIPVQSAFAGVGGDARIALIAGIRILDSGRNHRP